MAETYVVVSKIKKVVKEAGLRTGGDYIDAIVEPYFPDRGRLDRKGKSRWLEKDPRSRRPPVKALEIP